MKKIYLFFAALAFANVDAQIINIPDAAFKAKLVSASPSVHVAMGGATGVNWITIDTNANGEIEESEALLVYWLDISSAGITNLTGLEAFTNVDRFYCSDNPLGSLDITMLPNLKFVQALRCQLTSINFEGLEHLDSMYLNENSLSSINVDELPNLYRLSLNYNPMLTSLAIASESLGELTCTNTPLQTLDIANCPYLYTLVCVDTDITTLDISNNHYLSSLDVRNNALLTTMFLKNGVNENPLKMQGCFALTYICADDVSLPAIQTKIDAYNLVNCHTDSYCSFTPGGVYYTVNGSQKYDADENGCDASDPFIPRLRLNLTGGSSSGTVYPNASGEYQILLGAGSHTITPALENSAYFNCSPASLSVNYPGDANPFMQNFCITPNGQHNDLEVYLTPLVPARPGFQNPYKLTYKNTGTHVQSGNVTLDFNGILMDLSIAAPETTSQTDNSLSWDFSNLQPFESRSIFLKLELNTPSETPAVNDGDILDFIVTVNSTLVDETPNNNTIALHQTVVNSFDPNDKTCLEGNIVGPEVAGEYVHYQIRFENTGTFAAENIVVKDVIDTNKFEVSTLIPLDGSHNYVTRINGNTVEFIFENINLPFDDANNDGYVVFKIKTKPTLVLGDTFSNSASIYFDFNFPIVTEPAVTTVSLLKTEDFEGSNAFRIYPNPASDVLNIQATANEKAQSVSIYNMLGQLVISANGVEQSKAIDVSVLETGNYFVKITADNAVSNMQFVKK